MWDPAKIPPSFAGLIIDVLDPYNVSGTDTLIGKIPPPESLMKTLTDRKLAKEQKFTHDTRRMAGRVKVTADAEARSPGC